MYRGSSPLRHRFMKYLIVGASGFLGGTMMSVLKLAGHDVLGTRARAERPDLLPFDLLTDRIDERIPRPWLDAGAETCAVICACVCQVDRCYRERDVTRKINVENTIRLIEDLRSRGCESIVHFDGPRLRRPHGLLRRRRAALADS